MAAPDLGSCPVAAWCSSPLQEGEVLSMNTSNSLKGENSSLGQYLFCSLCKKKAQKLFQKRIRKYFLQFPLYSSSIHSHWTGDIRRCISSYFLSYLFVTLLSMHLSCCLTCWYNLHLQPPMAAHSLHAIWKKKKRERKRKKKGKEAIVFLEKDTCFLSKSFLSSCLFNTAWEHLPQGQFGFLWREWHRDLERPFLNLCCFHARACPLLSSVLPWFPAAQPKLETELMSFCIIHSSCIKLTNSWSPTCLEPAPIRRWNEAKQLYL